MAHLGAERRIHTSLRGIRIAAMLASCLAMSACAQFGGDSGPEAVLAGKHAGTETASATPQSELEKATEYWGKAFAKSPSDLDAALAYSKNLKAMGEKQRALAVLQQAANFHGSDRKLASEYGRLALDLDQLRVAKPLLEAADDPAKPDWRVISARGTVLAKEGNYKDAIAMYERALTLAPGHPSVTNNLALTYALNGEALKAEPLLRQAAEDTNAGAKVHQNLALVLGLQGKYDESKQIASAHISPANASENANLLRQMVKLEPKPAPALKPAAPAGPAGFGSWEPQIAAAETVQ